MQVPKIAAAFIFAILGKKDIALLAGRTARKGAQIFQRICREELVRHLA
ncbi:MAG: hypothetical protein ACJA0X_001984 [Cyclobacteriaceae bacterium]